jgi:hypothetical protein
VYAFLTRVLPSRTAGLASVTLGFGALCLALGIATATFNSMKAAIFHGHDIEIHNSRDFEHVLRIFVFTFSAWVRI